MSKRLLNAALLTGLLAGGTAVAVIPATAAPVAETTSTTFQVTCRAVPSAFSGPSSDGKPATVRVSAPSVVAPGQVFDIDVDPGSVQIPNDVSGASVKKISRLKIDLPIPTNAEFVSATVTDPGNVVAGKPASVIRVNEDGTPAADGPILRLSGANEAIGNSPSSSSGAHGGLAINAQSGAETNIVFPKIRITVKAGPSGAVETNVRTSGAAGTFGGPESFLTFLPQVSHWLAGTIWAPTSCSPRDGETGPLNAGAGALASTKIDGDLGPVDPEPGADIVTTLEGPTTAATGTKVSFASHVDPENATGTVQFMVDGKPVGDPRPVVRGIARLDLTFGKAGTKSVTAVFTATGDEAKYTSAAHMLTVTGDSTGPVDPDPTDPGTPGGLGSLESVLPQLPSGSLGGK